MAKIRLRMGPCEVEIESGDFYVDNDTASAAIDRIARSMQRVAAPRAQVLAAPEEAAATATATAAAGTADAGSSGYNGNGGGYSGRAAGRAGGSRPLPTPAAAASTAAAAPPIAEAPPIRRAAKAGQAAPLPQRRQECPDLSSVLDCLDEAEVFEPEFDEPRRVPPSEVASRLRVLASGGFFVEPRTVTEAVEGMAERGWLAGPLDVSKALARMSMGREMRRETRGYKTYYCGAQAAGPASPPPLAGPAPVPVPS